MTQVEIVVLANSVKHGQHCVAGKCVHSGRWIRPVSNVHGAELSHDQARSENPFGIYPAKPLQKIKMGLSKHVPLLHQPENFLIDGSLWKQNFLIKVGELPKYLDDPADIWGDGNRVLHAQIAMGRYNIDQSLYLVRVDGLNLYVTEDGKRRASFTYNTIDYDLAVTDPRFDGIIADQDEFLGILCISLGEEHKGYCYKLVATIF